MTQLPLQRTQARFPSSTPGSSQPLLTPDPGSDPPPLASLSTCDACSAHTYTQAHTCTRLRNKPKNQSTLIPFQSESNHL